MTPRLFPHSIPLRAAIVASCLTASATGAIEVAGELLIDLDATDYKTEEGIWPQRPDTAFPEISSSSRTARPSSRRSAAGRRWCSTVMATTSPVP